VVTLSFFMSLFVVGLDVLGGFSSLPNVVVEAMLCSSLWAWVRGYLAGVGSSAPAALLLRQVRGGRLIFTEVQPALPEL
jgi:hypothetical protein